MKINVFFLCKIQRKLKKILYTYYNTSLIVLKSGLLCGSYVQHCDISEYNRGGQLLGNGSLSPFSSFPMTSLFLIPWNGFTPNIKISHVQTPRNVIC